MQEATGDNTNYKFVLTIVDHFSKYRWCRIIPNKESETVIEIFELIFGKFGNPNILQTDHGKEFKNEQVIAFCKNRRIDLIHGSVRHPQSQGVVEKINDLICQSLNHSLNEFKGTNLGKTKRVWNIRNALEAFESNSNSRIHRVTKISPQELIMVREKLNKQHQKLVAEVQTMVNEYYTTKHMKVKKYYQGKNEVVYHTKGYKEEKQEYSTKAY